MRRRYLVILRKYFPISVAIFLAVIVTVRYFSMPILPFAAILLFGETLIGFQLEDHKVPHVLGDLLRAFKSSLKIRAS
jgi:hypothetical protein